MKSPLPITIIALVAGLLFLFCGHSIPGVRNLDSQLVQLYTPYNTVIDQDAFIKGRVSFSPLVKSESLREKYQVISITDDPDNIFETSPPSPLDYAVILDVLHEQASQSVILTTRAAWDDHSQIELQALNSRLALFDRSIIALPVTRGATKKMMPSSLKRSVIPFSNIKGKHQTLPVVNQVTLANHANGDTQTYAGFSEIESSGETDMKSIQMLAQWEDEGVIPSLELLMLMSAYDITLSDITIQCGQSIQLGNKGLHIPIDQFGRALTHQKSIKVAPLETMDAETLLEITAEKNAVIKPTTSIIQATGENVISTNLFSQERLSHLMKVSTQFKTAGDELHFFKTPLWVEIFITVNLSLFIYIILELKAASRHIFFLILLLALFVLFIALMTTLSNWIFISAPLATILTAWLLNTFFYKGLTSKA